MESKGEKLLSEVEEMLKKGHRKYTIEFEQKVLELINLKYTLHFLSNKLGIDRKVFRDWIKKKNLILLVKNKDIKYRCNRIKGLNTLVLMKKMKIKYITGLLKKGLIIYLLVLKPYIICRNSR